MQPAALVARDLVKVYRGRRVLDGVSLTAVPGRRIGLIGENGAGKSTLLRLLAGVEEPDAGTVTRPDALGFGRQELPFPGDDTVAAVLDDALRETRDAVRELDRLADALTGRPDDPDLLTAYGERLEWAQDHDAWDADRRADLVLAGLGLGGIARTRRLETLSGGRRSRLALAALLLRRPAALLLDEPTNHLDDDAANFLELELRRLPGVVVAASHDRAFLDAVCTDIVDLDPAPDGPTRYGGTYTDYLTAWRAARARWEQRYAREQDELVALRHAVAVTSRQVAHDRGPRDNDKMGYDYLGGRVQSQISRVRNAAQRLDTITREQVRRPPEPLRFRAPVSAGGADGDGPAVALHGVRVPARLALDRLDVAAADRLLVTGANGAGKSTLLAVLAGELTPVAGQVRRRRGLRVGMLAQDARFDRPGRIAQDIYAAHLGTERAERTPLTSLGLLAPRDAGRPVGELSVGQRRRLALALLVADAPHLLLLDEPTNHLSPALADELEEALRTSPGAIVVASHDRWLRRRWTGRELTLHNGRPA
ncbi:ATP-binding cassette domain-containing protein [Pseudonocardia sp. H11422]|uniref:ATP-binding cassette domain-containing protein n=1 Tax=Pseudonocardia sp. H11422 TaxID=2835866 RepID=UPI001BDD3DF9|nr:ATP-binding cassette domain-containing protein [Pseudonocardia sp. H11422]